MNRIFKNTSSLFSAHLIGRFGSLVITLWLMPRIFTENELGGYFVAIAITNLIASLTELGIQNPLIREMTLQLDQTRHYLGNALLVRLIMSIVAYALMIISGISLGYTTIIITMIVYLGLAEIVNSIAQLYRCVFRAHEDMKYEALTVVAERATFCIVGGIAILHGYELVNVCQVALIASGINMLLSIGFTRYRFTSLRFKPNREVIKVLMQQALPFAVGNLFHLIYFRVDAIMLSKLSPFGVVANTWYGLPYTFVNAFTTLPGAFMMGAMFPVLSRVYENERDRLSSTYTFGVRWMVICAVPLTVGLTIISPEISRVLFSTYNQDTIEKIADAMRWLSVSGGMIFLTTVVLTILRAADKRRVFTILMGTTALLNIGLNLFLIPRFSHVGAAVAMVVSEVYLLIIGFRYISKHIAKLTEISYIFKSILLSTVMGIGLVLLKGILTIWILIPLSILFYGGGIAVLGEIRTQYEYD
ncbi:MAG: flippase [Candidatus Poribacteria bacterium]|nr:flippase [Candidatus Poribacteria bacterium]